MLGAAAAGAIASLLPFPRPGAYAADKASPLPFPADDQESLCDLDWFAHYGDGPDLAAADPLTPVWRPANLGIGWERQNLRNGEVTWLSKDVSLPVALSGQGLRLDVKMAAAQVDAWCNGQPVGQNKAAGQPASFDLPAALLRWDRPNRLALRVSRHWWTGGVNEDIVRLVADGKARSGVVVEEAVAPADYIFPADADAAFDVSIKAPAGFDTALHLSVEVVSDFHATIFADASVISIGDGMPLRHFNLGRLQPGFYQVVLRYSHGDRHGQRVFWFGVAPTLIPSTPHPAADFEAYWARAKDELSQVRPDFKMVLDVARGTPRHRVYSVEMASFDGVTVRAWYIVPSKPGRYAAVLNVPGYSVAQNPDEYRKDDDIVYLALDVRGQGRSTDVVNPGFGIPGLLGYRIDDPEHYVYKGLYLDCGRALEFLLSRPEVDPARIAVAGGSQGGGLAFASAALYPDIVKACIAGSPYLGDFVDHMRIRDIYRGEMQGHVDHVPGVTWEGVYRAMNLVDTVNLAPRIRCPVLMGSGLFDDDCPPYIGFAVFNGIKSPKSYLVYPRLGHILWDRWEQDSKAWLRRQFRI